VLFLPPKLKTSFDLNKHESVVVAELTMDVLDSKRSNQSQVAFNIDNSNERKIRLNFPAAGGDPTQEETAELIADSPGNEFPVALLYDGITRDASSIFQTGLFNAPSFAFQTFTVGDDFLSSSSITSIVVKIKKEVASSFWRIKAKIYEVDEQGQLVGFGSRQSSKSLFPGGVDSTTTYDIAAASVGTSEVSFDFSQAFIPGSRYAMWVYPFRTGGTLVGPLTAYWIGSEKLNAEEKAGGETGPSGANIGEFGLWTKVNVSAFSYNGTTNPYVDISMDMIDTPIAAGKWAFRDKRPRVYDPGSKTVKQTDVQYEAWSGATLGAKTTYIGIVTDGDDISNLSRFYVVRASLRTSNTTTMIRSPEVNRVNAVFPKAVNGQIQRTRFSSAPLRLDGEDLIPGVAKFPIFSSKFDISRYITKQGTLKVELIDFNGSTNEALSRQHLKGRPFTLYFGHKTNATSITDLIPVWTGIVDDYSSSEKSHNLIIKNDSSLLKQKVPEPVVGLEPRRDYRFKELVDVIEEILADDAKMSRGKLVLDSFNDLKTYLKGSDPTSLWISGRVLKEHVDARKLLDELLELCGAYLHFQNDGKARLIRFPRSDTPVASWDKVTMIDDGQKSGYSETIINQMLVFYDRDGDGSNKGLEFLINDDSQEALAVGSDVYVADRIIKSPWLGPERTTFGATIAGRITKRTVDLRKFGLIPFSCKTPISEFEAEEGDYTRITSKSFLKKYEIGAIEKDFMILSKAPNISAGEITWDLVEVIDTNRKPTASFTADVTSGAPSLTVTLTDTSVDPDGIIIGWEWDSDYDGTNFTVDSVLQNPSFTYAASAAGNKVVKLRVTDDNGAVSESDGLLIRIFKNPVADMRYEISAPDQPLLLKIFSASYSETSTIIKAEWDLNYTGVFSSTVEGQSATVLLPYQQVTVALRVTDDDGGTNTTTMIFSGKAFAPATPTRFIVNQIGGDLIFSVDANTEPDFFAFEFRQGGSIGNSILIASEVDATTFKTAAPVEPGTYTYLARAINTSKRYSISAASIVVTVFDTKDRNIIVTDDQKAKGWPGTMIGLVHEVTANKLWIDSTDQQTLGDTTPTLGDTRITVLAGTRVSGSYEAPAIDLGAVIEGNRLAINIDTEIVPDPPGTSTITEYSISTDGLSYGNWIQIIQGELSFRFVKIRVTLNNEDGTSNVALTKLTIIVDVRDVDDRGSVVVPVGGASVLFGRVFNIAPFVNKTTVIAATVGFLLDITNITKTGFDVKIRAGESPYAEIGGTLHWGAEGY